MIINEFVNEKVDKEVKTITYHTLMKELAAINRKFSFAEIVLSELPKEDIIPGFAVIWKSSPGAVGVRTVQDCIKELKVVVKETEDLNKKYAGKYFED